MLIQKTVYIREEDLGTWENVSNKAQFMHDALNQRMNLKEIIDANDKLVTEGLKVIKTPAQAKTLYKKILKSDGVCEHGYAIGMCKMEKCNRKYK